MLNKYNFILLSLNLLIGSQRNVDFWCTSSSPDEPIFIIATQGTCEFKHRGNLVWNDYSFSGALHFKTSPESQTDSRRNVIISTKRCQVQMALSCPTTIPVEFSTLEISSGRAIPYYQSIKRSKLPACTTKPPFDRDSGLLLMVAIKALGGVFLQGLTGRLQTAPTLPTGCRDQPTQPHRLWTACSRLTDTAWEVHRNKVQLCT